MKQKFNVMKIFEHILAILLTLTLLGCSPVVLDAAPMLPGDVTLLQPMTSWNGISSAVQGARYVELWTNGRQVLLSWFQSPGRGFTPMSLNAIDPVGQWRWLSGGKAMYTDAKGFTTMIEGLKAGGWYQIQPQELPPGFVQKVLVGASAVAQLAQTISLIWCSIVGASALGDFPAYPAGVEITN